MLSNLILMTLLLAPDEAGLAAADLPLLADEAQSREEEARQRAEEARAREEEARERAREAEERIEEIYENAQEGLDEGHWDAAIKLFDEVVRQKGRRADAALYWKAYALNRRGQRAEALAALAELQKAFSKSRWLGDAKALEVEVRQAAGQGVSPEAESDEELKLIALNNLIHTDAERALSMLEKLLAGNQSPKVKDRALFVLCQSPSPRAREIVLRVARGGNPDLQLRAIRYLGMFGGADSRQVLQDLYASAAEVAVKRAILQSFMMAGERGRLLAVAKGETVPELRRDAIQQLGMMGAQAELWEMYRTENAFEMKKAMIQAFTMGGDADRLIELARVEKEPELRRTAIGNLGMMGAPKTADALVALYAGEKDRGVRKQVIEAFFIQGNAKALVDLGRKETDPELKKDIVAKLSHMNSREARDFLLEILSK